MKRTIIGTHLVWFGGMAVGVMLGSRFDYWVVLTLAALGAVLGLVGGFILLTVTEPPKADLDATEESA